MENQKFSRLPELAKPILYDICLKPDLKTFKFNGSETITLEVKQATDFFTLYAHKIAVKSASIKFADGTNAELSSENVISDDQNMLLTVKLPKMVQAQDIVDLGFKYTGELDDSMQGFYRSMYKDSNGDQKFMATTQFESTYARKAFPCWDEPIYKAKFDISIEVSPELTALSNMHVVNEQTTGEGTKIVKFATTPLMSTYLVAFAVGDFTSIHAKTKTGIDIGIYAVNIPGRDGNSEFSLEVATKAMDWYTEWFNIPMPLSKCDLIAVPDFSAGAMENWGLITFREILLIHDAEKSSDQMKMLSALVIAHEISHFWFGNLVTMKWWTDLWLKEGFATFMQFLFVGYNYPEFKSWLNFVSEKFTSGLDLDSLRNSHPIEVPIENPNELSEIYDHITYSKASSVNRMLYYHLGENVFQQGLRKYLSKFQFSNAETRDLWNSLSEVSGQNIESMMNSWTRQMGFPLVTVEQRHLDGDRRELLLKQKRYLADGQPDNLGSLWEIPIGIAKETSPNEACQKILLRAASGSFTIDGIKSTEWIKLNAGTTGFYRVNYSDEMFQQLLPAFYSQKMAIIDRFSFASDLFALVMSGEAPVTRFLALLNGCGSESEYTIWEAIDSGIGAISNVLDYIGDGKTLQERFCGFAIKNLYPLAEKLTWTPKDGEDMHTRLLRQLTFSRLIKLGHTTSIKTANAMFRDYVDKKTDLDANLRPIIFSSVTRMNDRQAIAELRNIFETVNFNEVETNCLGALGQICDATLLDSIYEYAIVEDKVRSQDLMTLFFGSATTKVGKAFSWEYFKKELPRIISKYGSVDSNVFQRVLKATAGSHCTSEMAQEVETFFKHNLDETQQKILNRPILQSLESIRLKERLMKSTEKVLDNFLTSNGF